MTIAEQFIKDLETFINDQAADLNEKDKKACIDAALNCLRLNFKYQTIYIPTQDRQALLSRNKAIYADFTGHNHNDLARKHRLSLQQIYSIIRNQRKAAEGVAKPDKPVFLLVLDEHLPFDIAATGVSQNYAAALSQKIAAYILENYAGAFFTLPAKQNGRG
ncbi:hypothetical protein A1507_19220 [Methylomonas koyamae]|uniref:Mor transcription activator domain-containing protein n=1 Tax=Methylomonas koyamae TaxID=702114 RepID=A0A177N2I0_9GAMM|nr:Mor transcription activator family protein [Methylomonas koyamae]OAI12061.1 hypothetical protein A1507_19220 [Methylomonas koyamae]